MTRCRCAAASNFHGSPSRCLVGEARWSACRAPKADGHRGIHPKQTYVWSLDGQGIPVKSHPAVGSRSPPGRTSSPTARSASEWDACERRDAGTSTRPFLRATSRAPCCGGRQSRLPEPVMPCSRASNSRKPDLVASLEYLAQIFEPKRPREPNGNRVYRGRRVRIKSNRSFPARNVPGHVVQSLGADFLKRELVLKKPVPRPERDPMP